MIVGLTNNLGDGRGDRSIRRGVRLVEDFLHFNYSSGAHWLYAAYMFWDTDDLRNRIICGFPSWVAHSYFAGKRSIKVDLEDFKKGTYLYSLVNDDGTIIGTKRLVIVKP